MSVSQDPLAQAKPFQFGLRSLFIGIALSGIVLAIMVHIEPGWSVAIVWSLLLIAAHVAGNAWGTKSHGASPWRRASTADPGYDATNTEIEFAPATRLRHSSRLTSSMLATSVAGATIGAVAGTTTIIYLYHGTVSYLGTSIVSILGATLGALLGFLASSFLGIFGRALHEASHGP